MGGSVFQGYCNEGLILSKVNQGAPTKLPHLGTFLMFTQIFVALCRWYAVDGRNLAPVNMQFISNLSHCLQGIYTWNPNNLYFWRSTPQNKAFSNQNKGHLCSRYIYIPGGDRDFWLPSTVSISKSQESALKMSRPWTFWVDRRSEEMFFPRKKWHLYPPWN